MKKMISVVMLAALCFTTIMASAQMEGTDKSKRPSPPDSVMATVNGKMISVNYSSPSLKGRTMGKDVEPMVGKVWRAGANEATVFETDKDVTVEGKALPAGKYSLFVLVNSDGSWSFIFNKNWNIWGTEYDKNKAGDVLKVTVKPAMQSSSTERLKYAISADGLVSLMWGTTDAGFHVN